MNYTSHLNLKKPAYTDPVDVQDINDNMDVIDNRLKNSTSYAIATGTNAYAVNIAGVSLTEGLSVKIKFTNANTGAATLNINGLGAKAIKKSNGNALSAGNIKAGQICHLVYTGSVFQLLGEGGEYGTATASDVLSGKTIGTENGLVTGTMPNRGAVSNTITTQGGSYTIPSGYHNGSGIITASFANLTADNVKKGVNIGGVVGTVEPAPSIDSYNLSIFYAGDGRKFMGATQYVRAPYTTNAYLFSVECGSSRAFDISSSEYFYGGKTGSQGVAIDMIKRTTMTIGASSLDHYIVFNPLGATITFEGPDTGTIEYSPLIS